MAQVQGLQWEAILAERKTQGTLGRESPDKDLSPRPLVQGSMPAVPRRQDPLPTLTQLGTPTPSRVKRSHVNQRVQAVTGCSRPGTWSAGNSLVRQVRTGHGVSMRGPSDQKCAPWGSSTQGRGRGWKWVHPGALWVSSSLPHAYILGLAPRPTAHNCHPVNA